MPEKAPLVGLEEQAVAVGVTKRLLLRLIVAIWTVLLLIGCTVDIEETTFGSESCETSEEKLSCFLGDVYDKALGQGCKECHGESKKYAAVYLWREPHQDAETKQKEILFCDHINRSWSSIKDKPDHAGYKSHFEILEKWVENIEADKENTGCEDFDTL